MSGRLEKKGEECHATRDFCDVMRHGFVFRLVIFTDREEALRKYRLSHGTLSAKEFQEQFLQHSFLPSHTALVKNQALQNPAFLPAVRLAKLWAASQMLSHGVPEFLLEELMVHVFVTQQPLTPSRGFLLLLHRRRAADRRDAAPDLRAGCLHRDALRLGVAVHAPGA